MVISRRLLQHDPSLATERSTVMEVTPLHDSGCLGGLSEAFVNEYMDMLVTHGADITAENNRGRTPLGCAADEGAYWPLLYLCQRLSAADINRQLRPVRWSVQRTALSFAAQGLQWGIERGDPPEKLNDVQRYGASIGLMPTDLSDILLQERSLVLEQYEAVLNDLPSHVMAAINAALEPQRDTAAHIGCLLPMAPHHDGAYPSPAPSNLSFGPQEATAIAWKMAHSSTTPRLPGPSLTSTWSPTPSSSAA